MEVKVEERYCYRVQWSPDDGEFVGTCAELPGLSWLDESLGSALSGIVQVAGECVADMVAHGERVPVPLSERG